MSWRKVFNIALTSILLASTVSADLIPPGGGRTRPHRAWIELYADRMPHGMILIFVDGNGTLLEKAHEREALRINRSGTVYGVREDELSRLFAKLSG